MRSELGPVERRSEEYVVGGSKTLCRLKRHAGRAEVDVCCAYSQTYIAYPCIAAQRAKVGK